MAKTIEWQENQAKKGGRREKRKAQPVEILVGSPRNFPAGFHTSRQVSILRLNTKLA
jgi:hypothetical protein